MAHLAAAASVLLAGCHSAPPPPAHTPSPTATAATTTTLTPEAVEELAMHLAPQTSDTTTGRYEHIVSRTGDVDDAGQPTGPQLRREYWTDTVGTGRTLQAQLANTNANTNPGLDSVIVRCPPADTRRNDRITMWDGPIPPDPNTLLLWLLPKSLDDEPQSTLNLVLLRRVTDLFHNRLVPPASRAALLRTLARQPGLDFDLVQSPNSRWLSVRSRGHEPITPTGSAVPTGRMLVIDADTGNLSWSKIFPLTGQPSTAPHPGTAGQTPPEKQQQLTITIISRDRTTDIEHTAQTCAPPDNG
ncbi:hypothetical protein AB0M46_21500 [Dactylosporangium sp. NPDC051485]|uniref:hypothetical protein n=1 Tax=Dactylosporangium sp. NPDC051485 TaxID=3154846 RepID=UPI003435AB86